jgi:hypothetical protein
MSTIDLAQRVVDNLEFDQVICECYNAANSPNSGWVHVSLLPLNRWRRRAGAPSPALRRAPGAVGQ